MDVIGYLSAFNRKERFFLVGMALGNTNFMIGGKLTARLQNELGLRVPTNAFAAMDYHLDWIYASLQLDRHNGNRGPYDNVAKVIRAQQEDIDFLIAFHENATCHLVLLEAKGATGWSNRQMRSKVERFREIFGEGGDAFEGVQPHFVLVSPRRPFKLVTDTWPAWMKRDGSVPWIEMAMSPERLRVTRCTSEGISSKSGDHWRVVPA